MRVFRKNDDMVREKDEAVDMKEDMCCDSGAENLPDKLGAEKIDSSGRVKGEAKTLEKSFSINAKIKRDEENAMVSATAGWQELCGEEGNGGGFQVESNVSIDEKPEFELDADGDGFGLKTEITKYLLDLNVSTFSMLPVKDPPLPADLKGQHFIALGTHSRIDLVRCYSDGNSLALKKFLNTLTVIRKLDGEIFPIGLAKEVTDRNSKAGISVLSLESSERALLNRLMIELINWTVMFLLGIIFLGLILMFFSTGHRNTCVISTTQACRVPSSMWSKIGRLKRSIMPKITKGNVLYGSGASPGIMSCIAGRLLCDTYISSRDLLRGGTPCHMRFWINDVECGESDVGSLELMFYLSVLPLTRQLTNISGNLWGKTLQGARAQRVEYLLLHAFHAKKYMVPDKFSAINKELSKTKRKVNAGIDGENDDNSNDAIFDNDGKQNDHGREGKLLPTLVDWYWSQRREYNICFTTVERPIDDTIPNLPSSENFGILPELLRNLVERRKTVKKLLKNASGLKLQQLDIQQQALKLTANSMYGCLGFSNSRFYAKPIAELITSQGREILQSTVDMVQNNLNLEVIYGDTDSILIFSGLDDISKAKAIAAKVIQEVIERKGLDIVRRDWSLLSKDVGDFCLSQILSGGTCEDVVELIHSYLMKVQEEMRKGEITLEKYVITKSLTKMPEDYPDAKNQPHVQDASSGSSTGIAQRARHPDELKRDNSEWMVDIDYYLSQQIHPVVSRLCASIQGTSPARLADCLGIDSSKFQHKSSDESNKDAPHVLPVIDDDDRYLGCEPLRLTCPSCSCSFECPPISTFFSPESNANATGLEAENKMDANFWRRMRCLRCPEDIEGCKITPSMITNQVKRQADHFISLYYKGLMMCDDEICKYTTRSLNLRVMGESERGTICPNYPHCNGHLIRQYNEADLYRQLSYFCYLLDATRCIEKLDQNSRATYERDVATIYSAVHPAQLVIRKLRDRCAYGWVQLKDLTVSV
ncbi:hypothetical protein HPP92_025019 [Vanilla planifolia]|uniref:DNA-directed DNA polymerase n=1 Tax=Vanilla planifolia TaxID=51239 RepID=A0A835PH76_VANPL|nr:hypothetical protein HPP92_025019 [Vanilla planifolia]